MMGSLTTIILLLLCAAIITASKNLYTGSVSLGFDQLKSTEENSQISSSQEDVGPTNVFPIPIHERKQHISIIQRTVPTAQFQYPLKVEKMEDASDRKIQPNDLLKSKEEMDMINDLEIVQKLKERQSELKKHLEQHESRNIQKIKSQTETKRRREEERRKALSEQQALHVRAQKEREYQRELAAERQQLLEERQQLENEKEMMEKELQRQSIIQEQRREEEKKRQIEMENQRLEEERKRVFEETKRKLAEDELRKHLEEERIQRQKEEKKRREEEARIMSELRKREEAEQQRRKEDQAQKEAILIKSEQEKKRLVQEESRKQLLERRRMKEEIERIAKERNAIEKEKDRIEAERKQLETLLKKKHEEASRIEAEAIRIQQERINELREKLEQQKQENEKLLERQKSVTSTVPTTTRDFMFGNVNQNSVMQSAYNSNELSIDNPPAGSQNEFSTTRPLIKKVIKLNRLQKLKSLPIMEIGAESTTTTTSTIPVIVTTRIPDARLNPDSKLYVYGTPKLIVPLVRKKILLKSTIKQDLTPESTSIPNRAQSEEHAQYYETWNKNKINSLTDQENPITTSLSQLPLNEQFSTGGGGFYGIIDPRLEGQEMNKEQLDKMCVGIKGLTRSFGIKNPKKFAEQNCSLIKMYYNKVTCEQIVHVMEYCEPILNSKRH